MARPIKGFWFFLLGLFGLHGGSAQAIDLVLCATGVVGESEYPGAVGCIDVLAWSWGLSNTTSYAGSVGGGGVNIGAPNFQDISLTKYQDTASEDLIRLTSLSPPISGVVELRAYNPCVGCSNPVPFMTIRTNGTYVTSLSAGGSNGEDRLTENVNYTYAEISYCYRPTVKGVLGNAQCFAFSRTKGTAISPF